MFHNKKHRASKTATIDVLLLYFHHQLTVIFDEERTSPMMERAFLLITVFGRSLVPVTDRNQRENFSLCAFQSCEFSPDFRSREELEGRQVTQAGFCTVAPSGFCKNSFCSSPALLILTAKGADKWKNRFC